MSWVRPHIPFALFAALALAGCGFEPLYGDHGAVDGSGEVTGVAVDQIHDRLGVVMTDHLRDSLNPPDSTTPRYRLGVALNEKMVGLGTLPDGTAAFTTVSVTADWRLRRSTDDKVVDSGSITASAGYDVLNDNYANVVSQNTREDRVVDELTAAIEERVALYLKTHPAES